MKTVSIDVLKRSLSSFIEQAAAGERFVITKHRRPVASLTAAGTEHVRIGARFRRARLKPALKGPTKGHYLAVLLDDRRPSDNTR
jgi:antitoxin (DNA-binding transcriptional repressor) of toxin-antitoxin stability system